MMLSLFIYSLLGHIRDAKNDLYYLDYHCCYSDAIAYSHAFSILAYHQADHGSNSHDYEDGIEYVADKK